MQRSTVRLRGLTMPGDKRSFLLTAGIATLIGIAFLAVGLILAQAVER